MEEKEQNIINPNEENFDNSHNMLSLKPNEIDLLKLPREENIQNNENNEENLKSEAEKNLLFEVNKVSCFYLYYHISGKFEMFLMITATIFTLAAGCSNAIIALLIGNTINKFIDTSEIDKLPDSEYDTIINKVEPEINKMVKIFLIFGACMFVCNFFMMFLWGYSALRQMNWMKIMIMLHHK